MKKLSLIFLVLVTTVLAAGCFSEPVTNSADTHQAETSAGQEEELVPVYADEIKDGVYEINVDSSASMFRVVKCVLTVEDGAMTAVMTMSGQGYGKVYMGTGEEALNASDDEVIPFVLNENGEKTFTVPVEALNMETECAAWSIKKEKWYDRTLIFEAEAIDKDAFIPER